MTTATPRRHTAHLLAAAKLAAAGVLVASVLPFGARQWWVLDVASHFRVQYVAAAAILIVALAVRRQWLWCAALAVSLAISARPLLPYLPFGAPAVAATTTSGPPVKVLTVNLLFSNHSTARLLETVREESPDIVVFVEFTPGWSSLVEPLRASYPHRLELPIERSAGIALFSRLPLDTANVLPLGRSPAIEAQVRTPAGMFTLIGVHLRSPTSGWRAGQRNWQYERLEQRLDEIEGPVLVTGDFNTTPYSPFLSEWLERTGLVDTRRGRGLAWSWPTFLPIVGIPIDHCVVSEDFRVISARRLPAFGSDHYPILTELALEPRPSASPHVPGEGAR